MRYCKTCGIHYRTPINSCLFCNNKLEEDNVLDEDMKFFYPPMKKEPKAKKTVKKILYFILLFGTISCLGIGLIYKNSTQGIISSWSIYVLLSCLLAAIVIHEFSTPSNVFHKIYLTGLSTLMFLIAIALLGDSYHWALDYVLPFGLLALNILSTCCIFGSKERLYEYSIYVFSTSILAFIPLLLYFLSIISVGWPALSCCLYAVLTLFGLFFFSTKESKEELKRRLHC
ncbi:DUF6320 domain-containing protein [Anaerosporobacter sp.]